MQYFLDSAKIPFIKEALEKFPIDGVTTNPTILARDIEDGCDPKGLLFEIRKITEGKTLFVQVTGKTSDEMVFEAKLIKEKLGGDIVIKVPSNEAGFCAIKKLSETGIRTTATACYSVSQALLAAKSGADYVAPYISHIDNLSLDGPAIAGEMAREIAFHGLRTQVLAASFRTASQVARCLENGVTSATLTLDMLKILSSHPGTDKELQSFEKNWDSKFGKSISEILK